MTDVVVRASKAFKVMIVFVRWFTYENGSPSLVITMDSISPSTEVPEVNNMRLNIAPSNRGETSHL